MYQNFRLNPNKWSKMIIFVPILTAFKVISIFSRHLEHEQLLVWKKTIIYKLNLFNPAMHRILALSNLFQKIIIFSNFADSKSLFFCQTLLIRSFKMSRSFLNLLVNIFLRIYKLYFCFFFVSTRCWNVITSFVILLTRFSFAGWPETSTVRTSCSRICWENLGQI